MKTKLVLLILVSAVSLRPSNLFAFEGHIRAVLLRGGETIPLLYTAGTNCLRIEVTVTNRPYPVDLWDRDSGGLTLIFPHNRSFVRLKPEGLRAQTTSPGFPTTPTPPRSLGPQPQPGVRPGIGPASLPGAPTLPALPQMPPAGGVPAMPLPLRVPMELKATGEHTNLLGYDCEKLEIKQRGETMEIWATSRLLPFQNYLFNQPQHFGPALMEEQWGMMLEQKHLFPLRAVLRLDDGLERYRFDVQSVVPETVDDDGRLFQPPPAYREVQPLPF